MKISVPHKIHLECNSNEAWSSFDYVDRYGVKWTPSENYPGWFFPYVLTHEEFLKYYPLTPHKLEGNIYVEAKYVKLPQ